MISEVIVTFRGPDEGQKKRRVASGSWAGYLGFPRQQIQSVLLFLLTFGRPVKEHNKLDKLNLLLK